MHHHSYGLCSWTSRFTSKMEVTPKKHVSELSSPRHPESSHKYWKSMGVTGERDIQKTSKTSIHLPPWEGNISQQKSLLSWWFSFSLSVGVLDKRCFWRATLLELKRIPFHQISRKGSRRFGWEEIGWSCRASQEEADPWNNFSAGWGVVTPQKWVASEKFFFLECICSHGCFQK